jgi:hypothetical protein
MNKLRTKTKYVPQRINADVTLVPIVSTVKLQSLFGRAIAKAFFLL